MSLLSKRRGRRFPIWQAVLFYAATLIIGQLVGGNPKKSRGLYETKMVQAPWAPPGWVFGPAWSLINIFLTRALFVLIYDEDKKRRDKALLVLQGGIWIIFCTFGYVYFRRRSPVLAAVWTLADAGLAVASLVIARKRDKTFSLHYAPLLLWTGFASSVAIYQAAYNDDPALGTGALID